MAPQWLLQGGRRRPVCGHAPMGAAHTHTHSEARHNLLPTGTQHHSRRTQSSSSIVRPTAALGLSSGGCPLAGWRRRASSPAAWVPHEPPPQRMHEFQDLGLQTESLPELCRIGQ
jgi:hypothetical protein